MFAHPLDLILTINPMVIPKRYLSHFRKKERIHISQSLYSWTHSDIFSPLSLKQVIKYSIVVLWTELSPHL